MEDERTRNKPKFNDGSLPIMWYDFKDMPHISRGIWEAFQATGNDGIGGWPSILTYDHKSFATMSRSKKRYGMNAAGVPSNAFPGLSRDEYPFASTVENAGSTFVSMVPVEEQDAHARMLNSFYSTHGAYKGVEGKPFWFEVKLKNPPQPQ